MPNSTVGLALNALQMWKDEADCSGLVMWRERIVMIGFQHVDVLQLMEYEIAAGQGRLGEWVKEDLVNIKICSIEIK